MSCTEAEARTRWCPFYRVATSGGGESTYETDNRPMVQIDTTPNEPNPNRKKWVDTGEIHPTGGCIGSRCMAWQWVTPEYQCLDSLNDEPEEWYLPADGWHRVGEKEHCPSCRKKSTMKMLHRWKKNEPRHGLCGLASR